MSGLHFLKPGAPIKIEKPSYNKFTASKPLMSHSAIPLPRTRPPWAEPTTVIDDLKHDIDNLKRDISELRLENGKNRASITKLSDIMCTLQNQYNEMLSGYDDAKSRIVELECELSALRAANKKMSEKAKSTPKRERSRSRSLMRVPRIVVKQNRGNYQVRSHPCFNHPNCIIVDGVHGSLDSLH